MEETALLKYKPSINKNKIHSKTHSTQTFQKLNAVFAIVKKVRENSFILQKANLFVINVFLVNLFIEG